MRQTAPLFLLLLAACGPTDADKSGVDTDVGDPTDTSGEDSSTPAVDTDSDTDVVLQDTDPTTGAPVSCPPPPALGLEYACDMSVNHASVALAPDHGKPLVLEIHASAPNAIGGFNGNGRGNRAIAGFDGYSRKPLKDLTEISFDTKKISGSYSVEVGLQLDIECDGKTLAFLSVIETSIGAPITVDTLSRYQVRPDRAQWYAQGGIVDPTNALAKLLYDPGDAAGSPQTLTALLAAPGFEAACIRNLNAGFRDLPNRFPTSGILLTLGSSVSYNQSSRWEIYRVQVNSDVLLPPE